MTAKAKNSAGEASASITLHWGCAPLAALKTIGDDQTNLDIRGRFAFDVSALAGKEIVYSKLKLVVEYKSPDPVISRAISLFIIMIFSLI